MCHFKELQDGKESSASALLRDSMFPHFPSRMMMLQDFSKPTEAEKEDKNNS